MYDHGPKADDTVPPEAANSAAAVSTNVLVPSTAMVPSMDVTAGDMDGDNVCEMHWWRPQETVQPPTEPVPECGDYDDEPPFAFRQSPALIVEEFSNRWEHRNSL